MMQWQQVCMLIDHQYLQYSHFSLGVECAKVLLVFLSKAYMESTNCQLEFRYAVQRGKAFVILRIEPDILMEQWMLEAIEGFPQYDVYSYKVLAELINGVPMVYKEIYLINLN
jgi:hypothetical protein